jgi:hypothetical protein
MGGTILAAGLIVAVVFGGLGAWVATQKDRGQGEGFILGLLFGPLGVLIEALLPAGASGRTPASSPPSSRRAAIGGPRTSAPGPVRPLRSLKAEDVEIPRPGDPPDWRRYHRPSTGEVFFTPAPEPEPASEPEPPPPTPGPRRWEKPLRPPGPDLE